jgi:hypothetical protein
MRSVTLENGVLHLRSEEAVKMFEHLAADGLVMEYLSALFDERANGVSAIRLENIEKQLSEVLKNIERMERTIKISTKLGVGANNALTPSVDSAESKQDENPNTVITTSVDTSKMTGKGISALTKMRNMGTTK